MVLLLLKNFFSSKIVLIGLLTILTAGVIGIYIGKQHVQKHRSNIEKTIHSQQEHIQRNIKFFDKDIGLLLYYLRFAFINNASALSGLSIGQRDVNPSIQQVNIRNLENQKYDTDLYNPTNLLAGNLDFGFVLIYLFPLLIISVAYNLLSEEKEGGTMKLVAVQTVKPINLLLQKLYIRAMVIYALLVLLFTLSAVILSIRFSAEFAAVLGIAFLYVAFWFAVCFWVVSWQRGSSVNAVSLLMLWVLLTVILPALVNNYISNKYPVPEALATAVEQREGFHEKWDIDKGATMNSFYAHYPQFKNYRLPDKQFSWLWYYAMQQMGDDDARQHAIDMKEKLFLRNKATKKIALFIPSLHTQLQLNTLTRSGLDNHLKFLDHTEKFHEQKRLHFYPRIFDEAPVESEDWGRFRPEYFTERVNPDWLYMYLPLLVATAILALFCVSNFSRKIEP